MVNTCAEQFGIDLVNSVSLAPNEMCDYLVDEGIISFLIMDEGLLCEYADRERMRRGLRPCFLEQEGIETDYDGWYDFYIRLDKTTVKDFYFNVSTPSEDDWQCYEIPCSPAVKDALYNKVNKIIQEMSGRTIAELIEEDERIYG